MKTIAELHSRNSCREIWVSKKIAEEVLEEEDGKIEIDEMVGGEVDLLLGPSWGMAK